MHHEATPEVHLRRPHQKVLVGPSVAHRPQAVEVAVGRGQDLVTGARQVRLGRAEPARVVAIGRIQVSEDTQEARDVLGLPPVNGTVEIDGRHGSAAQNARRHTDDDLLHSARGQAPAGSRRIGGARFEDYTGAVEQGAGSSSAPACAEAGTFRLPGVVVQRWHADLRGSRPVVVDVRGSQGSGACGHALVAHHAKLSTRCGTAALRRSAGGPGPDRLDSRPSRRSEEAPRP